MLTVCPVDDISILQKHRFLKTTYTYGGRKDWFDNLPHWYILSFTAYCNNSAAPIRCYCSFPSTAKGF